MFIVIGSGPAGLAVTIALLSRGYKVTMVDKGEKLDNNLNLIKTAIASCQSNIERKDLIEAFKEPGRKAFRSSEDHKKLSYGSKFPYFNEHIQNNARITQSLAFGGLSNVWGAAILPYRDSELDGWPNSIKQEMPQHYSEVMKIIPLTIRENVSGLSFPLYSKEYQLINLGNQAKKLYAHINNNKDDLEKNGINIGGARLAVGNKKLLSNQGCLSCGLCMYGCPYDLIFNSAEVINRLKENNNFTYLENHRVLICSEETNGVKINVDIDGVYKEIVGEKIFLACGVIGTAKIILESMSLYNKSFRIKDSQYFTFPFITDFKNMELQEDKVNTLSELFIHFYEINDFKVNAHLQIYGYNDLYYEIFKSKFGVATASVIKPLLTNLLKKMMAVQGYLHSKNSSEMILTLNKISNNLSKVAVQGVVNTNTQVYIQEILTRIKINKKIIGGFPITKMLNIGLPGEGNHSGGTFPMASKPSGFETDVLGRLKNWNKIHIVDSSVFPTIAPTTITLTVMANAHRIGINHDK